MSTASSPGELDSVTLSSADGTTEAEFVPGANMLCASLRCDGDELLDPGQGVAAYAEQGKTMGIPLLYPWANRLSGFAYAAAGRRVTLTPGDPRIPIDPGGLPIHGVLPGLLRWELDSPPQNGELTARLEWTSAELLEVFPFRHELRLNARAARGSLTLATTVSAIAEDPVPVSFGYHPYVRVPGSPRDDWAVTVAASRHLLLDGRMIPTGESEPVREPAFALAGTSLDDGYAGLDCPAEFVAAAGGRALSVEFLSGYSFAQIYAPPGQQFICFEPMTAPTDALNSGEGLEVLEPGGSHRAEFRISVSDR